MNAPQDWDPRAPEVLADPIAAYDHMRRRCPVAHSDYLHHSVFRHADVMRILLDHETFSSQASRHVSVPNSMDPPKHTAYRQLIEPYFGPDRMAAFEPVCRRLRADLVAALPRNEHVEIMFGLAHPFALRMQCAFLGWPTACTNRCGSGSTRRTSPRSRATRMRSRPWPPNTTRPSAPC